MKIAVVYHRLAIDGWMSAAIVSRHYKKVYKTDVDLIGWDYNDSEPELKGYDMIALTDITLSKETMLELFEYFGGAMVWIDHHKVIDELAPYADDKDVQGFRSKDFAACELAWMWAYATAIPALIEYLGKYDTFRHIGTDVEEKIFTFQMGARVYIHSVETALNILNEYERDSYAIGNDTFIKIYEAGEIILKYERMQAGRIMAASFDVILRIEVEAEEGYEFKDLLPGKSYDIEYANGIYRINRSIKAVNRLGINPATSKIDYHGMGYDAFLSFGYVGKSWKFTLYSSIFDVGEIAKRLYGGGHKGAARFIFDKEQFFEFMNKRIINVKI
jgi:oligoribonuclease NrnB/cAMP/cGMP phosphodiesterase (DHH superfamily)